MSFGSHGHYGSAVTETLLKEKRPVRVVVRSADKGASWKANEAAALFEEMYTSFSKGAIGREYPDKLVRGTVTLGEALRRIVQGGHYGNGCGSH